MKLASEGYPFILVFGFATGVAAYLGGLLFAFVPFLLMLFMCYFFRDPERDVPSERDVFVSPADGKVFLVRDVREEKYLHTETKEVSIFMSPLDVHVNRAPCDGTVKKVTRNKGRFAAAYREDSSLTNENIEVVLETAYGDIMLRQVAGFVARRAVCRKKEGDRLARGDRYGMIKFSSRLDIYLPRNSTIAVKVGDRVKAGETVVAKV